MIFFYRTTYAGGPGNVAGAVPVFRYICVAMTKAPSR